MERTTKTHNHLSITSTNFRSHFILLVYKWPPNKDHLSTMDTLWGVPRVVVVHKSVSVSKFKWCHIWTNPLPEKFCWHQFIVFWRVHKNLWVWNELFYREYLLALSATIFTFSGTFPISIWYQFYVQIFFSPENPILKKKLQNKIYCVTISISLKRTASVRIP